LLNEEAHNLSVVYSSNDEKEDVEELFETAM
jgi:hypothetical protein